MRDVEFKYGFYVEVSSLFVEDSGDMLVLSNISLMKIGLGLLIFGLRLCFEYWIFFKEEWLERNRVLFEFLFRVKVELNFWRDSDSYFFFFNDYSLMLLFIFEFVKVFLEV